MRSQTQRRATPLLRDASAATSGRGTRQLLHAPRTNAADAVGTVGTASHSSKGAALRKPSGRASPSPSPSPSALSSSPTAASSVKSTPSGNATAAKKKVDEILKRMQPHTIVQGYHKTAVALRQRASLVMNGEPLEGTAIDADSLSTKWTKTQKKPDIAPVSTAETTAAAGATRFHYASCVQYTPPPQTAFSLSTIKSLEVSLASLSTGICTTLFTARAILPTKAWTLVAGSTDRKLGLALYAIAIGPWQASSLLALVWTPRLEVAHLYLQLHTAEALYVCPPRTIRIQEDDVDPAHGLHSYTTALTLRGLQRVCWESECYSVAFPPLPATVATSSKGKSSCATSTTTSSVCVDLLSEENAYRDRGRYTTSAPALSLATEAITLEMENVLLVDFTVWDAGCNPIWGFSQPVAITSREKARHADDFTVTGTGSEACQVLQLVYHDSGRGNRLTVELEVLADGSKGKGKSKRVFVKQATLEFSLTFIDQTFGTNHALSTRAK